MPARFVRRPLPLNLLAAGAVGAAFVLTPPASAQIGPATAEQSDAPEPRFGMFRDPAGYEGSERFDPIDFNGELLIAGDEELTLSVFKGINGAEAMERENAAEGATLDRGDAPIARGADGAAGAGGEPSEQKVRIGRRTRVYINGERAKASDLRPGDRVRVRGVDRDGSGVSRIVALRTDELDGTGPRDPIGTPDGPTYGGGAAATAPGGAKRDGAATGDRADEIRRAAETGVTTPGGGGFVDNDSSLKGESKKNVEQRKSQGVTIGGNGSAAPGGEGMPEDAKRAPGFGFVVSDSPGEGVLVADVQPGGPAAEAGVRAGDYLTRMNDQSVQTPEDVKKLAKQNAGPEGETQPIPVTVWRDGGTENFEITPGPAGRDYFPGSTRDAMSGSNRTGVEPSLGVRTRDSDSSGVDILAASAMGALAAEAGEDDAPAYGGYGGGVGGFYGDDLAVYGNDAFGLGYAGGFGVRPAVTVPNQFEQRLENEAMRRRMFEARANAASGLDAEDYWSGTYPTEEGSKYQGLMPGDRVIGVNNNPIHGRSELRQAIRSYRGKSLTLNIVRNGERKNLTLTKREAANAAG